MQKNKCQDVYKRQVIECLGKITESSRHLLGLINEVLDMARIESGKMTLAQEDFNLSELVDNLITLKMCIRDRACSRHSHCPFWIRRDNLRLESHTSK